VRATRIDAMKEHAMAHEARHGSGDNGHGAVDRDWLRPEIHRLETSLHDWQARWHHTPGPPRHRIQRVIDRLHRELALTLGLEPS
jgi:hypothetical protein